MQNKATEYVRKQLNLSEDEPLALQHWLRVLGQAETLAKITVNHDADELIIFSPEITFNLITGQPATEADYQAFNQIIGIWTP